MVLERRRRALVIDDDPVQRELVCRFLERMGVKAEEAPSGRDAVRMVLSEAAPYHLVVTDVVMPDLSGVDVMLALRRAGSNVPIVILSGVSSDEIAEPVASAGAAIHVRKPMHPRAFADVVRAFLWPV